MTLPSDFWQLPAIAVMAILIIGWLLWSQREERKSAADERIKYSQYMQKLLDASEEDRQNHLNKLTELIRSGVVAQEQSAAAIATLTESFCREMEAHEARTEQRFQSHEEKAVERHQVLVDRISACIPAQE